MIKKIFVTFGLLFCIPLLYAPPSTNNGIVLNEATARMNQEFSNIETPVQEKVVQNTSKASRARKTGRIIGIIVLAIVTLLTVVVAGLAGLAGYVGFAHYMGWVRF